MTERQRRFGFAAQMAEFLGEPDGFAEEVLAALCMSQPESQQGGPDQRMEAHRVARVVHGARSLEPCPTLGVMATDVPEKSQRTRESRVAGGVGIGDFIERSAQVVVFGIKPSEP